MSQGLWVIIGLLAFHLLEKMFPDEDGFEDSTSDSDLNFNLSVSAYTGISLSHMPIQAFTCVHWYAV